MFEWQYGDIADGGLMGIMIAKQAGSSTWMRNMAGVWIFLPFKMRYFRRIFQLGKVPLYEARRSAIGRFGQNWDIHSLQPGCAGRFGETGSKWRLDRGERRNVTFLHFLYLSSVNLIHPNLCSTSRWWWNGSLLATRKQSTRLGPQMLSKSTNTASQSSLAVCYLRTQ